ncbi:asparaginase [Streptomyces pseudoechinosporeus]
MLRPNQCPGIAGVPGRALSPLTRTSRRRKAIRTEMSAPTRVLYLYTGGTIGMVNSPRGYELGVDVAGEIAELLRDADLGVTFDVVELERLIDSSNAAPADWQAMIDHIRERSADYDGVVVLHGTNTLAHSAAAVSFGLIGPAQPIVFTGSQIPFGVPGTDARTNVLGATRAVMSGPPSVSLFFAGKLFAGTRATKVSAVELEGFQSPHTAPLHPSSGENGPPTTAAARNWARPLPYRAQDIAVITATPGMTADRFRAATTPAPAAVIFRTYGAGEGPSDEKGLAEAIEELVAHKVPVVITSQCVQAHIDLHKYAAGEFLHRAGAIGVKDMTFEAVYVKLTFLLSQGLTGQDVTDWLLTDLVGELTSVGLRATDQRVEQIARPR